MKKQQLSDFYSDRQGQFVKQSSDEQFMQKLNKTLFSSEMEYYQDYSIEYPIIFVFGPPRSGTTLISQLIAHSFNIGYINNFVARFYLTPMHGLRLSKMIYGNKKRTNFQSNYAQTKEPTDIHEFGYFWRYWLKKEKIDGITNAENIEDSIDWSTLSKVMANIQNHFGSGLIFKNIFGSYHLSRMTKELKKVIYVYITRNLADAAISILGARRKYNKDLNTWWSYMPREYMQIKDMDYMRQIAGQVFYLKKYYDHKKSDLNNVLSITYQELAEDPLNILNQINRLSQQLFNHTFEISNQPPEKFPFSSYPDSVEKYRFQALINEHYHKDQQRNNHE